DAGLRLRPAHHAIVEAARDDPVVELEEESTDEVSQLRLRRELEKKSTCLRLPVGKEYEVVRLEPAPVIVRMLVVREAALDAVEIAGIRRQTVCLQKRQHGLG